LGIEAPREISLNSLFRSHLEALRGRLTDDEGQGMVEYALILVLLAVVVIVVLVLLGNQVKNVFRNISTGVGS
jgi:pilus assembly protein Flp/PilA